MSHPLSYREQMKPLPPKPIWYQYAQEVQMQVDNMRSTKSGKREADFIYRAWLTACQEKGYEGSPSDWEALLSRLRRQGGGS
jgi:hypothetical protein